VNQFLLIAKVVSLYGKDGSVRIASYSDFPGRFYSLKKVYFDFFGEKKEFIVEQVQKKKNYFLLKLKNFNSDKDSEILLNKEIYIDEKDKVKLPKDYFFIHDILGTTAYQKNKVLGKIVDVLSLPANDVFVIKENENEILFPAVKKYIEKFDVKEKVLIIKDDLDLNDED
jgi:16S rRNA processing protein RimM